MRLRVSSWMEQEEVVIGDWILDRWWGGSGSSNNNIGVPRDVGCAEFSNLISACAQFEIIDSRVYHHVNLHT